MIGTTSMLLQRLNRYLKQSSGYDVNQTNSYVYEVLQQLEASLPGFFQAPHSCIFSVGSQKSTYLFQEIILIGVHLPISATDLRTLSGNFDS